VKAPEELVRVVASPGFVPERGTGSVPERGTGSVPERGTGLAVGRDLPGRGAWLCAGSVACLELAARRGAFARALRTSVEPSAVASLREALAGRGRMEDGPTLR
jgi:predicted RNA-binding protein YlxR (DUF448 family)